MILTVQWFVLDSQCLYPIDGFSRDESFDNDLAKA